jgi:hypothetical protein
MYHVVVNIFTPRLQMRYIGLFYAAHESNIVGNIREALVRPECRIHAHIIFVI